MQKQVIKGARTRNLQIASSQKTVNPKPNLGWTCFVLTQLFACIIIAYKILFGRQTKQFESCSDGGPNRNMTLWWIINVAPKIMKSVVKSWEGWKMCFRCNKTRSFSFTSIFCTFQYGFEWQIMQSSVRKNPNFFPPRSPSCLDGTKIRVRKNIFIQKY